MSFPNHDRVFHDVFSFRDGKRFELGLYPVGAIKHVPFDRPGFEPGLLQHPSRDGGLHPRGRHVALRGDGSAGELLAAECPFRQLPVSRLASRRPDPERVRGGSAGVTAGCAMALKAAAVVVLLGLTAAPAPRSRSPAKSTSPAASRPRRPRGIDPGPYLRRQRLRLALFC